MASPSSIAGATDPSSRRSGLMPILRREPRPPSKRLRGATADDAVAPLTDEALLAIFDYVPDLADLVRIAATCRRWRNLVSGDAAFLGRTLRRLPGRFFGLLALGFFHHENAAAGTRFVPWAVAGATQRHFLGLHGQPSLPLSTLIDDGLFHSSHVVASRNGLLVVELRRAKHDRALRLCVCNPMSGAVHVLPPLVVKGDDGLGRRYACTVLAADDCNDDNTGMARPSSYFHLIMVYTRRGGSTTFHSYSPDGGGWSTEEKTVNCDELSQKQLRLMRGGGVVARDGRMVLWLAKNVVAALELATPRLHEVRVPWCANGQNFTMANTLLGLWPEGGLCLIQFDRTSLSPAKRKRRVSIGVYTCDYGRWKMKESIQVDQYLPDDATKVRLRWFCDRSGVIFFSAVAGDNDHRRSEVYALNLDTEAVEKVASHAVDRDWGDLHGYEMDQAAYLSSLAERDDMEDEYIVE